MTEPVVRFIHISDTHITANPAVTNENQSVPPAEGARALVWQINNLPFQPDFVLHTGDVAYDPTEADYRLAREILSEIQYPTHYIPGNHDNSQVMQRVFLEKEQVKPYHYYAFDVGNVQVVCLDSTGPATAPAGSLVEEQLDWLRILCQAPDERPLVVAVHHNALPVGVPWLDEFMRMTNGEELHQALLPARDRLRGVFFGHIHQNQQVLRDGILYSSVLSSWYQIHSWPGQTETTYEPDAEPGFNVVTITHNQTYIRHHRYPKPE